MSTRSQRHQTSAEKAKISPIAKDLAQNGLPSNLDAERLVLGSVLLDDSNFGYLAKLNPDDFTLERDRRILRVKNTVALCSLFVPFLRPAKMPIRALARWNLGQPQQ